MSDHTSVYGLHPNPSMLRSSVINRPANLFLETRMVSFSLLRRQIQFGSLLVFPPFSCHWLLRGPRGHGTARRQRHPMVGTDHRAVRDSLHAGGWDGPWRIHNTWLCLFLFVPYFLFLIPDSIVAFPETRFRLPPLTTRNIPPVSNHEQQLHSNVLICFPHSFRPSRYFQTKEDF